MGLLDWIRGKSSKRDAPVPDAISESAQGWVSVWVGDYTDELDLDGYLYDFGRDHGVAAHEDGGYSVVQAAMPMEQLFAEFWRSETWAPAMLERATATGVREASCMVVRLNYRHSEQVPPDSPLRFLGCVRISPDAPISAPSAGWVSAWVGDFDNESDLDGYLDRFDRDHGSAPHKKNSNYSIPGAPKPLGMLLEGFSLSEVWAPAMLECAATKGIREGRCALVRLHYRHIERTPPASRMRFIGCVRLSQP